MYWTFLLSGFVTTIRYKPMDSLKNPCFNESNLNRYYSSLVYGSWNLNITHLKKKSKKKDDKTSTVVIIQNWWQKVWQEKFIRLWVFWRQIDTNQNLFCKAQIKSFLSPDSRSSIWYKSMDLRYQSTGTWFPNDDSRNHKNLQLVFLKVQWTPINGITLGQTLTDPINWMILLSECYTT